MSQRITSGYASSLGQSAGTLARSSAQMRISAGLSRCVNQLAPCLWRCRLTGSIMNVGECGRVTLARTRTLPDVAEQCRRTGSLLSCQNIPICLRQKNPCLSVKKRSQRSAPQFDPYLRIADAVDRRSGHLLSRESFANLAVATPKRSPKTTAVYDCPNISVATQQILQLAYYSMPMLVPRRYESNFFYCRGVKV